ncbi:thiamine ABC transporter substrate-binding protein [Nocardioides sp. GY 10113]|uniref:thiamine ABC transporter substrate-binding protein n=1 Tax=Nocardioides sp. GY 10113 TaxID=2569761 RepID=UPI0010A8071E|nr:thiamine ABC transporter substrate-binding protein [Nocardioides sp. GY 10113]TIC89204.1 thiamine ABC transporter substrate-binding protein [Nocardioides sp. GY 10113]
MAFHFSRPARARLAAGAVLSALALSAAGCSLSGDDEPTPDAAASDGSTSGGDVVLVTHDSFSLPKKLIRAFESETGYTVVHTPAGDGGELTSKLELTADHPLGDVAFGVDNTFAASALDAGVFAPYDAALPAGADQYRLPGDEEHALTPVDTGEVCVNVDTAWFAERDLAPPADLDDLTDPAYEGLFVTPAATTSTPGMAFLLATIGQYGEGWTDYWSDLLANDAAIVKGWEDAYYVDFTYSGGDRPIVLSYDTSPAFTVEGGKTSTAALLDTCFRQVEYAGVLEGAANPDGARALVDWLLSPEVQAALPTSMYVFPVDADVALPKQWAAFAQQPTSTLEVAPDEIAENRRDWLSTWTELTSR